MARYAFQMDGDNVTGLWQGGDTAIPMGTSECTETQGTTFRSKSTVFPGSKIYRWTFIADVLAEIVDVRKVGTWTPDGDGSVNGDGDVEYDLDQDAAEPTVTLTITPGTVTITQIIEFNKIGPVKASSIDGVVTLAIETDSPRKFAVASSDLLQMSNRLLVRVSAVKI